MVAQLDRDTVRARPGRAVSRMVAYTLFEGRPALTRGQWFNPVVRANLAIGSRVPTPQVDRPITVVGIGRSGTTLLGRLLGVHSHVGFLNEPKAMWHAVVPDEDLIGSYGPEPVRLRLDADDATPEIRERAHRVFGWHRVLTRSSRLVDKYPELVYRAPFVRSLFPDGHVVAILRRPWDVVTSIESWEEAKATEQGDWWGIADRKWRVLWDQEVAVDPRWRPIVGCVDPGTDDPVVRATVEWIVGTAAALDVPAQLDHQRVHLVRYGDLVASPDEFLTDLLERCELPVEREVVDLGVAAVARTRPAAGQPPGLPDPLVELAERLAVEAGLS